MQFNHQELEREASLGQSVTLTGDDLKHRVAILNIAPIPKTLDARAFGVHLRGIALALVGAHARVHVRKYQNTIEVEILDDANSPQPPTNHAT